MSRIQTNLLKIPFYEIFSCDKMKPELLTMIANRGAFKYNDYEFEAGLGPRELRPMCTLGLNQLVLYEGEWKRDTDIA